MGDKQSCKKIKEERTVFLSKGNEVYRIPSLFYDRDKKIFIAFAEQRSTADDAHAKHLVMKTGTLKKEESTGVRAIEVIIPNNCFIAKLFVNLLCFLHTSLINVLSSGRSSKW